MSERLGTIAGVADLDLSGGEVAAIFHDVPAGVYRIEADPELGLALLIRTETPP